MSCDSSLSSMESSEENTKTFSVSGFQFFSDFDSGNLARVEAEEAGGGGATAQATPSTPAVPTVAETIKSNVEAALDINLEKPQEKPPELPYEYAFRMWTKPDCAQTEYENGNRTWFYFGIKGGPLDHPDPGTGFKGGYGSPKMLKISVMNLNKQAKLFSQGMVPIVMRVPAPPSPGGGGGGGPSLSKATLKQQFPGTWERLRERPTYWTNTEDNNNFVLTFRIKSDPKCITYLAFTYPHSYRELQVFLNKLDRKHGCSDKTYLELSPAAGAVTGEAGNAIYYHRENAVYSCEKRRIDLLTLTGMNGITDEREEKLADLFPAPAAATAAASTSKPGSNTLNIRPFKFTNKKVIFLSARVHPGETQSSFVISGMLKFLLRPTDPRAVALRKKYVFKIIPMLNPDGVHNGHYRTDLRGINLNRVYGSPSLEIHPSIYAAKKLLLYAHTGRDEPLDKPAPAAPANTRAAVPVPSKEVTAGCSSTPLRTTSTSQPFVGQGSPMSDSNQSSIHWLKSSIGGESASSCGSSEPTQKSNSLLNSWYEMTETSRCSEGDESIADFSVRDPTAASKLPNSSQLSFAGALSSPARRRLPFSESSDGEASSPTKKPSGRHPPPPPPPPFDVAEEENANLEFASPSADDGGPSDIKPDARTYNSLDPKLCSSNLPTSGLFLYVDIHGHASKRGIFMYGNHFGDMENRVAALLLPKLMSVNCANFDFPACNFTERNMYLKDRHTGAGREGSGRVSAYKSTGLVQSYTLECNFNTGRLVNCVPQASRDSGKASPPPQMNNILLGSTPSGVTSGTSDFVSAATAAGNGGAIGSGGVSIPKYTPETYEDAGKQLAISILDMTESNPWSRLTCSAYKNLRGVKEWIRKYVKHLEEQQQQRAAAKSSPEKGHFTSFGSSPVRTLRSSSSRTRVRTFSAGSASSSKRAGRAGKKTSSSSGNKSHLNTTPSSGSKASATSSCAGSAHHCGQPGSPGSYRPVSKIARKNSLVNQQQQQATSTGSSAGAKDKTSVQDTKKPKLVRSKSMINPTTTAPGESAASSSKASKSKSRSNSMASSRKGNSSSSVGPGMTSPIPPRQPRSKSAQRKSAAVTASEDDVSTASSSSVKVIKKRSSSSKRSNKKKQQPVRDDTGGNPGPHIAPDAGTKKPQGRMKKRKKL